MKPDKPDMIGARSNVAGGMAKPGRGRPEKRPPGVGPASIKRMQLRALGLKTTNTP